jgi:DNA-binding MarR family transcriptional regulator
VERGTVDWLDPLEMRAWRSLLTAHARLLARLDAELQATSSTSVADYAVLVHLSEAERGRMRMSELADVLNLSPSGLTRRLDGLVTGGFVERTKCPTDRRGAYAELTDLGRERLEEVAPRHLEQVRRNFVDRLDRSQLEALADALWVVADALGPTSVSVVGVGRTS